MRRHRYDNISRILRTSTTILIRVSPGIGSELVNRGSDSGLSDLRFHGRRLGGAVIVQAPEKYPKTKPEVDSSSCWDDFKIGFHDVSHIWASQVGSRAGPGPKVQRTTRMENGEESTNKKQKNRKRPWHSKVVLPNLNLYLLPSSSGSRYIRLLSLLTWRRGSRTGAGRCRHMQTHGRPLTTLGKKHGFLNL